MNADHSIVARFNLAMLALNRGHDILAVNIFKELVELRPDFIEAHFALGVAYGKRENFEEMVEAFTHAIRLDRAAVRRLVPVMVTSAQQPSDNDLADPEVSGTPMEGFLRELDEGHALIALAAEDLRRERDLAAIRALERSLSIAYPYELGMIVITIAYLLVKAAVQGGVAEVGENSVLKEVEPQLAACLFDSQ